MSVPTPLIQKIENQFLREKKLPSFRPGDTVKVWVKITEGSKTRLQAFEGVCIRRHRGGNRSTFTVRKISYGVGVERVFAENSPNVDRVEVKARGKVRQSRLYYLRGLSGKAARIKERAFDKAEARADGDKKKGKRRGKRRKAKAKAQAAAE
jgi:large subunit ribosomal protein L19